ncbi:MAG: hypothetical protein A3H29_16865 [Acidobacteria bacterium RIFCSPLOWO2_02_FULL_67_21]|nr:MAG: hypothetical protein A3H29_16865 [Acidobacteria bacterium RIFCSPLOWO2_02_FULL_67_21]
MTQIPTQVTFHGIRHSDVLEAEILERVAWLEQFYSRAIGCHVLVDVPHRHQRGARHVRVRVELTVPGGPPIVASHDPSLHASLKDSGEAAHHKESEVESVHRYAHVAIRETFDAARRRLQDFAREQRHATKTREAAL